MNSDEIKMLQVGNFTFVNQLNVIIGNRCTAKCDFCTNESSPDGKIHLALETCRQLVRQAKSLGFSSIGFSGGEPFLYRKTLLELTEIAQNESLSFVIATNGYWGKDTNKAYDLISTLHKRGLTKLQVSYDAEHARYVKKSAIYNVLNACANIGVPVILYSAYYPGEKRVNDILDLSGYKSIEVNEGEVLRVGRAKDNIVKFIGGTEEIPPIGNCPKALQMTVNFDGLVYPCCSVGGFSPGICVGNLTSERLGELSKNILDKTFISYLQTHDATWMAREIQRDHRVVCKSVCELCNVINSDAELLNKYGAIAEETMLETFLQNTTHQPVT